MDLNLCCVDDACGRSLPRPVAFCPYCGKRQVAAPLVAAPPPAAPVSLPLPHASTRPLPLWPDSPRPEPEPPAEAEPEPPAPPKRDLGPKPLHIPELDPQLTRPPPPPLRQPIRLRTWLLVLLGLAAIWLMAKPRDAGKKFDARIAAAVASTSDCRLDQARAELAALKTAKATPAQLKSLQTALAEAAPQCEKKRLRGKAWSEARSALDQALQAGALDQAANRLGVFVRRWGEDAESGEWGVKIDTRKTERLLDEADACLLKSDRICLENRLLAAESLKRPELAQRILGLRASLSTLLETSLLGAPARVISTAPANASAVRKSLTDAELLLAQGNYRDAIDQLDGCAADDGNCLALKQKAERLNRDMLRCTAGGGDWRKGRCK
ncbi:hypothetical protein AAKU55_002788 [Oxalobacteraceae bacterium GrIS 1.11]